MIKSGMKNKVLTIFILIIGLSSCKLVKPFFIKNEKKEERKDKREAKKEDKKSKNNPLKIDSAVIAKKDSLFIPKGDSLLARNIIKYRNIDFQTMQMSTKIRYESSAQKQNFSASFRILKDKIIWVSIHVPIIGEVARTIITPDSVKAIEKINKKVYLYTYKDIQKLINIELDFQSLQNIIAGNVMAINGSIHSIDDVNNVYAILIKATDFTNQLSYNKTDTTLTQYLLQTTRGLTNSSILVANSKFQNKENYLIPMQRDYHIQDVKGGASLSMDVNKIELNGVLEFPFKIPSNYKLVQNE